MQVSCPHCFEDVPCSADDPLVEVDCPACGSWFSFLEIWDDEPETVPRTIRHFELIEMLGQGAFGTVWKARDTKLDRDVAVKLPRKERLTGDEAERFLREARTAAQLRHPHLVGVHEVGMDDGQLYIVSDLIEGVSLADWLDDNRPTTARAVQLLLPLSEAVDYAHRHGVVHRDLTPRNVLIDQDGAPHVTDFGMAKHDVADITLTADGRVMGTPAYMSPEQAAGESNVADARSDVYSLGVILFELLTGELPFRGSPHLLISQILHDDTPSPRRFRPMPRDLETICLKCLRKAPAARYQSARELHEDLQRCADNKPIRARPVTRWEKSLRWCQRNPGVAALATLLAAVLSVSVVVGSTFWRRAEATNDVLRRQAYASEAREMVRAAQNGEIERVQEWLMETDAGHDGLRGWEADWLAAVSAQPLTTLEYGGTAFSVSFSPRDSRLAVGGFGSLKLFDLDQREPVVVLNKARRGATLFDPSTIAFSPDGDLLAALVTETKEGRQRYFIALLDPRTLEQRDAIRDVPGGRLLVPAVRLKFSPDGTLVATVSPLGVAVWAVETKEMLTVINPGESDDWNKTIVDVAISPDNRRIVVGADWLALYDSATGQIQTRLRGPEEQVSALAISPDGRRLASGHRNGAVKLWDLRTQSLLVESSDEAHRDAVSSIDFSRTGDAFATSSWDQRVCLWNADTAALTCEYAGHRAITQQITFSPTARYLASIATDGTCRIWDADPPTTMLWHPNSLQDLAVTSDAATIITSCYDGVIRSWDVASGTVRISTKAPEFNTSISASADGSRIAFRKGLLGTCLWEPVREDRENEGGRSDIFSKKPFVSMSPDGALLVCTDGPAVQVWSLKSDTVVDEFPLPAGEAISSSSYSESGRLLVIATRPGAVHVRNTSRRVKLASFRVGAIVGALAANSSDKWIAAVSGGRVHLWNLQDPSQSWDFQDGTPRALAFAHDDRTLAVGLSDGSISLWNLPCRRKVAALRGHRSGVTTLAFSKADDMLVSGSADRSVRIWRGGSGK